METYGRERRDRLSELPDAILCHILSFLPTKTSVATSILARRWRFVWAYVPNLDFDCTVENHRIINRVLLLHKLPTLRSLSINIDTQDDMFDQYKVETWINAAIDRKVQYLHLYVACRTDLPFRLFTCETLVDLTLRDCGEEIRTLDGVWLPRLKKLCLNGVEFEDDVSLPCLLSGCPILEYLRIESNFKVHFGFSCYISSPTVKWLFLESIVGSIAPLNQGYIVEINTPALEYLSVDDYLSGPIECGNLTSLSRADISHVNDEMVEDMDEDVEEDDSLSCVSLLKFVDNLSSVKSLKLDLSFYTTIIDSLLSAWTPSFDNLTKLKLIADSCFLPKFLESANNLEILELGEQRESWMSPQHQFGKQTKGWIEPQQVPICLLSCLRIIKIGNIVCTEDGLKIVRYLLKNAKVLKRMDITYPRSIDSESKNDLLQKISLFERVSKACELTFTEACTLTEASANDFSEWDWERISV